MAKQITQETFDAVVQENMEVFEMTEEEAVAEAIQQFEAQGVNLEMIVKEAKPKSDDSNGLHQVQISTENLRKWVESVDGDSKTLLDICDAFREACDKTLAERCLAAKEGAYGVLLSAIDKVAERYPDTVAVVLHSLQSFMTGQPDLLDDAGTSMLLKLLLSTDDAVVVRVLCILKLCCQLHEENRQRFVVQGIIGPLVEILKTRKCGSEVIKSACSVLRSLTLDDDIRVPFGKSHEHAKLIVEEADGIKLLLQLALDHKENTDILSEIFLTLSRLAVRDEFCRQVLDVGGIGNILTILKINIQNQNLEYSILGLLKTLAGSDPVKGEIVKQGGLETIVEIMNKYIRNAGLCDVGCATIAALVLRFPAHSKTALESGAPDCIVKLMQVHAKNASVQTSACMAVRNLVSRCPENSAAFLELGAEQQLRLTLSTHKGCQDEAKAALRDLGCQVELAERWKGTGKNLQQ